MSYILDALRRADAERERGAVPGIHAQRFAQEDPSEAESGPRIRPVVWFAGGALVCVLAGGALAWQWLKTEAPSNRQEAVRGAVTGAAPAPAVAAAPFQPAPASAPSVTSSPPAATKPAAAPAPSVATRPPAPVPAPKPAATPRAPRTATAPAARTPLTQRPVVADAPTAPVSPRRPLPAGGADPAAPTPSATRSAASPAAPPQAQRGQPAPPRIYARSELPEEIRRQLPTLSIGGSIYSQDRANRFLIINGQVFYEGAEPTPGLVIEQIGLKSAVLRFKDYRYSISY